MTDYSQLPIICQQAMKLASTQPGRYGGRYVARRYNKLTKSDEFLVLGDDDPELFKDDESLDILAQATPKCILPFGQARTWLGKDGSVYLG